MSELDEIQGNWESERCIKPEHVDYLIQRVEELESEINDWKDDSKHWGQKYIKEMEKSKRYREALERIVNAPEEMTKGKHSIFAEYEARQALEGEK